MRRGIPVRRSRAADWARLCGGLALPVLALGVIGTRSRAGPADGGAAGAHRRVSCSASLALGLAFYSLTDIWNSGAEGAWIGDRRDRLRLAGRSSSSAWSRRRLSRIRA